MGIPQILENKGKLRRLADKPEVVSLHIRYFITLGMYFDGFAINNKYIPHISLTIASAMQITETGMPGKI